MGPESYDSQPDLRKIIGVHEGPLCRRASETLKPPLGTFGDLWGPGPFWRRPPKC